MNTNFMVSIIGLLFTVVVSIIGWNISTFVRASFRIVQDHNDRMNEIERNYLSRFDDIKRCISKNKIEIIEKIHELELKMK